MSATIEKQRAFAFAQTQPNEMRRNSESASLAAELAPYLQGAVSADEMASLLVRRFNRDDKTIIAAPSVATNAPNPRTAEQSLFYPDGERVLINRASVRGAQEISSLERAVVTLRLTELRIDPVSPTFDQEHFRSIHRRLFSDIYSWAGEYRPTVASRMAGERHELGENVRQMFTDFREDVEFFKNDKSKLVDTISHHFAHLNNWKPFLSGNAVTGRSFVHQVAETAGYDFQMTRVPPDLWRDATRAFYALPPEPYLPAFVRGALRPLRARAFEEALTNQEREPAVQRHPELRAMFAVLDQADPAFKGKSLGHNRDSALAGNVSWLDGPLPDQRRFEAFVNRVQRALDAGVEPQRLWENQLQALMEGTRGLSR